MSERRAGAARTLLRAARQGMLATQAAGQPFASLVTPATAPDLSVLLLLSELADHTRHLRADPRCALLVTAPAPEPNPQTAPRVTVSGVAELADQPELRARYLAIHPYAALYAGFGDFRLWRLRPERGMFVGGFAQAARLHANELRVDAAIAAELAAAAAAVMDEWNRDRPEALTRMAGESGAWQMVALDADGCDLARGERVVRVPWSAPVASASELSRELTRLGGGVSEEGGQ